MPLRSDWSASTCPIARSLDVVGDPWLLLIVRQSLLGVRRYEDFRSALKVADNVLSKRLSAMVEAGLLTKTRYRGERRTHSEYVLTEACADLLPVLNALLIWGEKHTTSPHPGDRMGIVHRACGQESTSADRCSSCGERLVAADVAWTRPWLRAEAQPLTAAPA